MTASCPLGVCEHPEFVHDWEEPGERPMCCIEGCPCGRTVLYPTPGHVGCRTQKGGRLMADEQEINKWLAGRASVLRGEGPTE